LREKTNLNETEIQKKVDDRLEQVGLEGMGYKYPAELSGGMRKRAGLARALVTDPQIVLFDEPTTGLDPILAASIHQLIARTQRTFGFTAVVVSHTIPQVFDISDYVAILANGVIEEIKPSNEFQASKNPIVQQFIRGDTEGPIQVL
jgi:phospholipid/cholesterol/gamma-HCH transport system ATP-binding protein